MTDKFKGTSMLLRSLAAVIVAITVTGAASAAEAGGDVASTSPNLTRTTCSDLAAQSEEERAASLIFYYGYMAGLSGAVTVDESRVEAQFLAVRDYCNSHPEASVIAAFVAALKSAM
jgi:hypothetical protein